MMINHNLLLYSLFEDAFKVSFRAKNEHGALVRSYVVFRLNPEMDKLSIEDADMNIFSIFASDAINDNMNKY